jgi:hypothetical protein
MPCAYRLEGANGEEGWGEPTARAQVMTCDDRAKHPKNRMLRPYSAGGEGTLLNP